MKKLIACISASAWAIAALAQITVTKTNMPAAGDTFNFAVVQAVGAGIDVNNTGPNATWSFTHLTKSSNELIEYKRSSQTPYAFFFFNTFGQLVTDNIGFGQFSLSDVYNFYKVTNTAFTAEGIGFKFNNIPLAGFYTEKDEIYSLPLKYGDQTSSNFSVSIQLPVIGSYKQSGTRENEVDGWGTIALPGGGQPRNCLRVKSVINQLDSFSVTQPFPISFGFPSARVEYKWLTNTDRVPVLEVIGTEVLGTFTPGTARFREKSGNTGPGASVEEVKSDTKVNIYPNPASDKIIVSVTNTGDYHVKLFTMEGKETAVSAAFGEAGLEVNTKEVATGYYMLFVKAGNNIIWEKVAIAR